MKWRRAEAIRKEDKQVQIKNLKKEVPEDKRWGRATTIYPIVRSPGLYIGDNGFLTDEAGHPGFWSIESHIQNEGLATGMFRGEPRMIGGYGCIIDITKAAESLHKLGWHHKDVQRLIADWFEVYLNLCPVTSTQIAYIEHAYKMSLLDKGIYFNEPDMGIEYKRDFGITVMGFGKDDDE